MSFCTDSDEAKSPSIMENGSELLTSVVDSLAKAVSTVMAAAFDVFVGKHPVGCEHCLSTW